MYNKHLAVMVTRGKYRGAAVPRYGEGIIWDTIKSIGKKLLPVIAQKVIPKVLEKGKQFIVNKFKKRTDLSPRAKEILGLIEGV